MEIPQLTGPSEGCCTLAGVLQLCLGCSVLVCALQLWWSHAWSAGRARLPPGSMGYVGVGESLAMLANLHKFFETRHHQHGNIFKTHVMGSPTVVVMGGENVRRVYQAEHGDNMAVEACPANTMRALLGPHAIICSTGARHKHLRACVLRAFKKNYLQDYIPRIYIIIERSLNEWCGEDKVFVYKRMASMAFETAWEIVIGLPLPKEEFERVSKAFRVFTAGLVTARINIPGFPFYKALKAKEVLHYYVGKAIGAGDHLPSSSILAMLLTDQRQSAITYSTEQILGMTVELIFSSHAAITSAATSLVMCVARDNDVRNKLQRDIGEHELQDGQLGITVESLARMQYLTCVVKEVLRLYPPTGGAFRRARRAFCIGDYTVPEGWAVLADIYYTQREADIDEKEAFRPERWLSTQQSSTDYSYIPFAAGLRVCVGREYAKLFLRVFVICLLRTCDVQLLTEKVKLVQRPILQPDDYLPARFTHRAWQNNVEI